MCGGRFIIEFVVGPSCPIYREIELPCSCVTDAFGPHRHVRRERIYEDMS